MKIEMKILFVDDDVDMRELVTLALGFEGIYTVTAGSVDEARLALDAGAFDAIVCDYHLGAAGSGAHLLLHVQAHLPDVPFFVTTGDPEAGASLGLPQDHVLLKPIELETLAQVLKTATTSTD